MTKVLIDGDVLLYQACFSTEYNEWKHPTEGQFRRKQELISYLKFNYDDESEECLETNITPEVVKEPIKNTYRALDAMVASIVRNTGADSYLIVMKGVLPNFRDSVEYPVKYKGGRPGKPSNFKKADEYLRGKPCVHTCTGPWEVDDELGIIQDESSIIASIDKDVLYGLPGRKYNLSSTEMFYVYEHDAVRYFWRQMLMGDKADNIIGVKGIGTVKSNSLLPIDASKEQMRCIVEEQYQRGFDDWERMYNANKKLLWILREPLDAS